MAGGYLERAEVTDARTTNLLEYEHRARYEWAVRQLGSGQQVLAIAYGAGHGRYSERFRRYVFEGVLDRAVRPMGRDERPEYWVLRCRLPEPA